MIEPQWMIALATMAVLLSANTATAQTRTRDEWIANCLAKAESPEAQSAFTDEGGAAPTHERLVRFCVDSWNSLHPYRKIKPKTVP